LHGDTITKIYTDLIQTHHLDTDWIAEQVSFCDNMSGDIDTLSNRIRQIRTWTFVANRKNWLKDPVHWREKTQNIENRLSDALHERLTQRFVDRRTSVLIRHLRDKRMISPEINDKGDISLEGHLIGTLAGFRFTLSSPDGEADPKSLRSAASQAVAPEIRNRALRLATAPNEEIVLATDGYVRWRGDIIAELVEGDTIFAPRLLVLADESLTGPELEGVQERLNLWLRHHVNTQLEQILALREPAELEGAARGVAFQLSEHFGLMPRTAIAEEVKGLDQDVRGKMRKLGVKFGAYHIYVPQSLKPAPRELALILWALKNGGIRQPGVADLPHLVLSGRTSFEINPEVDPKLYEIAGFKVAGNRAVRVDILERLADIIRPLIALDPTRVEGEPPAGAAEKNGFRVTVEMTSLLGCAGEDFSSILKSLGYRVQRTPIVVEAPEATAAPTDGTAPEAAPQEDKSQETQPQEEPASQTAAEPQAETPQAEATPNADAPDAPEAPKEPQEPQEPQFDEVWFPGSRRPNQQRSGNARAKSHQGKDARKGGNRPHGEKGGKRNNNTQKHSQNRKPKADKPIDPDSPFAALAALKAKSGS
jgi:ATP-dependent RNA helicase SUPV3L1/SUV3